MSKREKFKGFPKHFVERGKRGKIVNWSAIGKSLAIDRRVKAKHISKSGFGHIGDLKIGKLKMPKFKFKM